MLSPNLDKSALLAMAKSNPKLCYLLEVVKANTIPRAYKLHAQFDTVTSGQRLPATLRKPMCNDAWIWELEYTIRAELAWAGNPHKPSYDYYTVRTPFVDVEIDFQGCGNSCCGVTTNMKVTDDPIPLETAMRAAGNPGPYESVIGDWRVIEKDHDLKMNFTLMRTLGATEVPYQVIVTAKMFEFDRCRTKLCDMDDATAIQRGLCDIGLLAEADKVL
jgi:hypothetical protein